ncbi:transporter [Bacillus sp. SA1-12]|uniref:MATE family efflux transporter n=1 Tax=Bacillus sp. SA1-12 TaxID=1455638 RepID=UPI00062746AD|nr:MATE family efflux transporter [Bacillus sp. SA1-12]KKI90825.1 transporter [Bacillus sp. SA1-12]
MDNKNSVIKLSLFAITWPIFIESALQMFLRTADTFMLSKVSDSAVAAVGVANQIIMFTFLLFNFVAVGSAVVITQYLGAQKRDEIGKLAATSISLNLLFGVLISLVMIFFCNPILHMFDLDPSLFSLAKSYLLIAGGSLFIQAVMITITAIIQSHGFTKYTMFVALGINAIHIVGNYLFIYGALGVPKLGVVGVAISTVISICIGLFINLLVLTKKVHVKIIWKNLFSWNKDHVKKILKIGIPASASNLSYSANQIVTTAFIVSLGSEMLSTRIYTQNIMFFIMILAISLGRGVQIIIGHLVGAGEKEEAYKQAFLNLRRSMIITLTAVLIICLFRNQLLSLFTDDSDIISLGSVLLLMGFLLEPGRNFNIFLERSLQAAGDARFSMFVSIFVIWCFSVPLTYLLGIHLGYGLIGMWVAFIADEWVRGLILCLRWKSRTWENKALIKHENKGTKAVIS